MKTDNEQRGTFYLGVWTLVILIAVIIWMPNHEVKPPVTRQYHNNEYTRVVPTDTLHSQIPNTIER